MNDPIVVTRDLVKRAAGDIETKIGWAFASGAAASFALQLANAYGIKIPDQIAVEIPYIFAIIGGYMKSSAGVKVITTRDTATGKVVTEESHSAPAVVTAGVPIQEPAKEYVNGGLSQSSDKMSVTDLIRNYSTAQQDSVNRPTEVFPPASSIDDH